MRERTKGQPKDLLNCPLCGFPPELLKRTDFIRCTNNLCPLYEIDIPQDWWQRRDWQKVPCTCRRMYQDRSMKDPACCRCMIELELSPEWGGMRDAVLGEQAKRAAKEGFLSVKTSEELLSEMKNAVKRGRKAFAEGDYVTHREAGRRLRKKRPD